MIEAMTKAGGPHFTVLTPAYNRACTLTRVYASLLRQSDQDFEWIVIDDGSTDNTAALVRNWTQESPFPVVYAWQENGHKKTALNHGLKLARGTFIVILDSDDELLPDALSRFREEWELIPDVEKPRFCGIRALCVDENDSVVGDRFPLDRFDASYSELLFRHGIRGEKLSCDLKSIISKFPFPEDVKGYVPEHVLWSQVSRHYLYRCINRPVRRYYDGLDSISRHLVRGHVAPDLEGLIYSYTYVLESDASWFWRSPWILIKAAANRKRFLAHLPHTGSTRQFPVRNISGQLLSVAFGWIGWILYLRDRVRKARMHRASIR